MKKNITHIACIAVCLFLGSASAGQKIWNIEQGYEVNQLRVTMYTADTGQVLVSECDRCEDVVLEIVPQTRLFKGNEEIPISDVMHYRGQEGVVFRATDTDLVTRIKIY